MSYIQLHQQIRFTTAAFAYVLGAWLGLSVKSKTRLGEPCGRGKSSRSSLSKSVEASTLFPRVWFTPSSIHPFRVAVTLTPESVVNACASVAG